MIEFLKKLADEGIETSIDTATHGVMKITLTHENSHSYYLDKIQVNGTSIELLYHVYDKLKACEAKQNDL